MCVEIYTNMITAQHTQFREETKRKPVQSFATGIESRKSYHGYSAHLEGSVSAVSTRRFAFAALIAHEYTFVTACIRVCSVAAKGER